MHALEQYVHTSAGALFTPPELNYVLLFTYKVLARAMHDGADTLLLTPTEFRWTRHGTELNTFSTTEPRPSISYRDELHRILERDAIVQRYVQLVDASDGIETFHLGEARPAPSAPSAH